MRVAGVRRSVPVAMKIIVVTVVETSNAATVAIVTSAAMTDVVVATTTAVVAVATIVVMTAVAVAVAMTVVIAAVMTISGATRRNARASGRSASIAARTTRISRPISI